MRSLTSLSLALLLLASGCSFGKRAAKVDPAPTAEAHADAAEPAAARASELPSSEGADGIVDCGSGKSHKGTLDVPKSELEGTASYYGKQYDGRLTASGEVFDMRKFSAAHRTL